MFVVYVGLIKIFRNIMYDKEEVKREKWRVFYPGKSLNCLFYLINSMFIFVFIKFFFLLLGFFLLTIRFLNWVVFQFERVSKIFRWFQINFRTRIR